MSAAHAWALFVSLPGSVRAALLLAAGLVLVGAVAVSLAAGRAAAWVADRLDARRESRAVPVDPFARVLRMPPAEVRREFQGIVEASADDAEAAL